MPIDAELPQTPDWSEDEEEEYLRYLEGERRAFAWVLRTYGTLDPHRARDESLKRYPYQPPDAPFRGLIFHDEAWHWAMLHLQGEGYWRTRPDLAHPPQEYRNADFHDEPSGPTNKH